MSETQTPEVEKSGAPEGSLASVREKFGTLIVDGGASAVLQRNYRSQGDRILINTEAVGIRGSKTGSSHEGGEPGSAFIDLALTPDVAQKVYEDLGRALESYKGKG